ncbi:hypothetical protein M2271_003083 [Streptomyces sp. LBL]|uniref:hypothetical protein n=1 Tax=Streptomyces sp. LBL TaxID=2940562 RepID=UPI0024746AF3|nr:hypothetical protein [Streptomyces sp. LBL]MDH6625272.1 hypothetical protein [Streptomyces sp. LBL]
MRLSRSLAPVTVAVCLVLSLPYDAMPHARVQAHTTVTPEPFGATCRSQVTGSHVIAYCHNPYVPVDRVSLHIECDRWWDIDSDGAAVAAGPAQTVRLTGRCWKEVRSVWVGHRKEDQVRQER